MREELTARMEEAMALEANASATDVWFYYADARQMTTGSASDGCRLVRFFSFLVGRNPPPTHKSTTEKNK